MFGFDLVGICRGNWWSLVWALWGTACRVLISGTRVRNRLRLLLVLWLRDYSQWFPACGGWRNPWVGYGGDWLWCVDGGTAVSGLLRVGVMAGWVNPKEVFGVVL